MPSRTKLAYLRVWQKRAKSVQKRGRSAFGPGMPFRTKLACLRMWQKRGKSVQKRAESAFGPEIDPEQNTLHETVS